MALPGNDAVARFQENEERFDKFLNTNGTYLDSFGNPVDTVPKLAVTLANLASSDPDKGSTLVMYKPPFVGSVPRSQSEKNSESLSVFDFGAIGDGIADDTDAINNALASAMTYHIKEVCIGFHKITGTIYLNAVGITLEGGKIKTNGLSTANLVWHGPTGKLMLDTTGSSRFSIRNVSLDGRGVADYGLCLDTAPSINQTPTGLPVISTSMRAVSLHNVIQFGCLKYGLWLSPGRWWNAQSALIQAEFINFKDPDIAGVSFYDCAFLGNGIANVACFGLNTLAVNIHNSNCGAYPQSSAGISPGTIIWPLYNFFIDQGCLTIYNANVAGARSPKFTGSISGTNLTVSTPPSNPIQLGSYLDGVGITQGNFIINQTSGTPGGIGIYSVSISQSLAPMSISAQSGDIYLNNIKAQVQVFGFYSETNDPGNSGGYGPAPHLAHSADFQSPTQYLGGCVIEGLTGYGSSLSEAKSIFWHSSIPLRITDSCLVGDVSLGTLCSSVICENVTFRFGAYFIGEGQGSLTSFGNNHSAASIINGSQAFFVRAWCVFNGITGVISSGNLFTGVTKNATGDYTLTMAINAPANYCVIATGGNNTTSGHVNVSATTTNTINLVTGVQNAYGPLDLNRISVAVIF